ncbi:MAG: hypothetical protein WHU95_01050 [candidate division WOR-3 bacterium]|jgi:hypothetical protein|nr:hypothetical protein [candidate division WOR-3 bacterium]MDH7518274.1 hypothetical protein [bacterium]
MPRLWLQLYYILELTNVNKPDSSKATSFVCFCRPELKAGIIFTSPTAYRKSTSARQCPMRETLVDLKGI